MISIPSTFNNFLCDIGKSGMIRRNEGCIYGLLMGIPLAIEGIRLGKQAYSAQWDKKRVLKNLAIGGVIAAVTVYSLQSRIASLAMQSITQVFQKSSFGLSASKSLGVWRKNIWNPPQPSNTKLNVYGGYSLIGLSHVIQSYRNYSKKNKVKALMHATMAVVGLATPIIMELGMSSTRWHHSAYGLLCALPGTSGLAVFGSAIALDSTGYWWQEAFGTPRCNYGIDNVFVNNMKNIVLMLVATASSEVLTTLFNSTFPQKEESPVNSDLV
ncbi:MAG: hypothetical protein ACI9S8_002680 [Chlamydiales bacterium]|jgi:hypothetical protein